MKTLRIASFMRGSTNKQTSEGKKKKAARSGKASARKIKEEDSLPEQKQLIQDFISTQPEANKGIEWVDSGLEFVEAGVSGYHTHTSKRIGLQDAFESAKRDEYDVLVIFKIDRFGRRSTESFEMAKKFLRFCRIWVVDKGVEFKNDGSLDEIQNFIEFWAAQKASEDTKIRVTAAMKLMHKEGIWTGGNAPYGFENHPEISNMLKAIPEEAAIVKEIYDLYVNHGYGYSKISSYLNDKGYKSRTGVNWGVHSIGKILSNTVYKGHLSYGKTKVIEGEFGAYQKRTGEGHVSERYWSEYDLIGADTWQKAQELKKSKVKPNMFGGKTPSKKATGKGLLVSVLKCECGGNMTYSTCSDWADSARTIKKEPYGIYRCQTRIKQGVKACGAKKATYRVDKLEKEIIDDIYEMTTQMVHSNAINKLMEKAKTSTADLKGKIDSLKKDKLQYEKAQENAQAEIMKIMLGQSTKNEEMYNKVYTQAQEQLEKLEKELLQFEELKTTDDMDEIDGNKLESYILAWKNVFDFGTQHQKRQLISSIINKITVTKDNIYLDAAVDIPKFVEAISAIKETAANEIATSLENTDILSAAPYLYNVDSRSSNSEHNTGIIETLTSKEIKEFTKKLSKVFTDTIKNKFTVSA